MGYERYRDWLDEACDDYGAAEALHGLGKYGKACFLSHQACEKALKALLIKKLNRYESIHSAAELLRRAGGAVGVPEELLRKAEHLDRFYIPTRYPNAWPSGAPHKHYTRDDAEVALKYAKDVMDFVKGEIERNPS
ncbi:MAG: HEPN domain-containing protein [Candidatus Bathyarchaeia archaeon]